MMSCSGETCNAHEQIGMIGQNQILHEGQTFFAADGVPSGARTFVQSVQDNKNRNLTREFERSFETFCKGGIARLFGAITPRVVQLMKRTPARLKYSPSWRRNFNMPRALCLEEYLKSNEK